MFTIIVLSFSEALLAISECVYDMSALSSLSSSSSSSSSSSLVLLSVLLLILFSLLCSGNQQMLSQAKKHYKLPNSKEPLKKFMDTLFIIQVK